MIALSRQPGEGRTRYQQRIATTRALEACVERSRSEADASTIVVVIDTLFDRSSDEKQKTAQAAARSW